MGKCYLGRVTSGNKSIEVVTMVLKIIAFPANLLNLLVAYNIRNIAYNHKVTLHDEAAKQVLALTVNYKNGNLSKFLLTC